MPLFKLHSPEEFLNPVTNWWFSSWRVGSWSFHPIWYVWWWREGFTRKVWGSIKQHRKTYHIIHQCVGGQFFGKQRVWTIIFSTLERRSPTFSAWLTFCWGFSIWVTSWGLWIRWTVVCSPLFPTFQRSKIWIISQKIQGKITCWREHTIEYWGQYSYLEHLENFSELFQLKSWSSFGSVQNGSKVKNLD